VFDVRKRLYRITQKGTASAQDSQGREYDEQFTEEYSFDGSVYREWRRSESAREQRVMGVITKDLSDAVLNRQCVKGEYLPLGLLTGYPAIFRLQIGDRIPFTFNLSSFLKENRTSIVSTNRHESGDIDVVLSFDWEVEKSRWLSLTAEIRFDPSDCVVTKQRVYYSRSSTAIEFSATLPTFVIRAGKKVPSSIVYQRIIDKIAEEYEIQFESLEINPPVDAHTFQIDFPDGAYVDDYVTKKFYKVGDPVDEDQAMYDFMQRHGLTGDVLLSSQRLSLLRYILMGAGLAMILFAFYKMIIQRWRK
jgi:hypothetical protein